MISLFMKTRFLGLAVLAALAMAIATPAAAVPVFSYYNDTGDPTIYKYYIFNAVSSFEVSQVVLDVPAATSISAPSGWTGVLAAGTATWTASSPVLIGPMEVITGFQLTGDSDKLIQPYTISGPQFNYSDVAIVPVPEPGSMLAMATGLVGMAGVVLRRRTKV